jgi:hypothetical protein
MAAGSIDVRRSVSRFLSRTALTTNNPGHWPQTALWEVSMHLDYIAVFRAARRQLGDLQSESRADCTLKRRVT